MAVRLIFLLGQILLLLVAPPARTNAAEYGRTASTPAVNMTYAELATLLKKMEAKSLASIEQQCSFEYRSIRLKQDHNELTFSSLNDLKKIQDPSYSLSYLYSCYGGIITEITLMMGDGSQTIRITGRSYDDVNDLVSIANADLGNFKTFYILPALRPVASIGLFVALYMIYLFFYYLKHHVFYTNYFPRIHLIALFACVAIAVLFPWSSVFPAAYFEETRLYWSQRLDGSLVAISLLSVSVSVVLPLLRKAI